jgi:hypothetical protein
MFLAARRNRERTGIAEVTALARQQAVRIDARIGFDRRPFGRGHGLNNLVKHCISLSGHHHDADSGRVAGGVGVHEMQLHGGALAGDQMLGRMVKMKLHQRVAIAAGQQCRAGSEIQPDRVAIVDDRIGCCAPPEDERRQPCRDRSHDIDR